MKRELAIVRRNMASWWLIGALVLAVVGLAVWRMAHLAAPAYSHEKSVPTMSSAWRIARGSALAVSGLSANDLYLPCSGISARHTPKPHPTAALYYSSIEPAEQIAAGEKLHAMAILDCPQGKGLPVLVYQTDGLEERLQLYDDGTHGDRVADDGLWEVDLIWDAKWFLNGKGWAGVYLGMANDYDFIAGASVEPIEKPARQTQADTELTILQKSQANSSSYRALEPR